ncbi:Myosin heavy chain-related protein [Euphorbia peplus]|nr:Myosin heavy chain-related protein [Euphorbia peplus]
MQQHRGQMEEDLSCAKEQLARTEGERDGLRNELREMKKQADDANARLSQSMHSGKVADVFSELNSVVQSLSKSNEEITIKEIAIKSLKDELVKAKDIEAKFAQKDANLYRLVAELSKSKERIKQLEAEMEKTKDLGPGNSSLAREVESLKNELKRAIEAEENNKKAMDDLAFALKEVATEANQSKEKLVLVQEELQKSKKESDGLKEALKTLDEKNKSILEEAKREADLQRNIADRLRLEAEETLEAWHGKETGLVDCIKRAEDEKIAAVEENTKLLEALTVAEHLNKTSKQENQKLRDILKQALNEANVAKEAAGIARSENSQLKDVLAEKDDALIFITRENENLRINEVTHMEHIKELKRLLSESTGIKSEEEEHEKQNKTHEKEQHTKQRKLSNAFSLNLKDLIAYPKHKDTHDQQEHKLHEKPNESEEEEDEENANLFKGSIFDETTDSPLAAQNHHHHHHHHHHSRKPSFADEGETGLNPEDLEHIDEAEIERNSKKKRALLRRFGDIITRKKGSGVHRRELSIGGEVQKKETSISATETNKKDQPASAPAAASDAHNKKEAFSEPAL